MTVSPLQMRVTLGPQGGPRASTCGGWRLALSLVKTGQEHNQL